MALRQKTDAEIVVMKAKATIENDPQLIKAKLDTEERIAKYKADRDYDARIEVAKITAASRPKPTDGKGQKGGGKQKAA